MDNNNIENVSSDIVDFFDGKFVFLTGATGFLGKAIVEKLLRSCPNVKNIFVLIRPKRGCEAKSRVAELLGCPLFDIVRSFKSWPELKTKIVPISGDMTLPDLGISDEDRTLLIEKVSIVIHSAATVKFDEPLKKAVKINVEGTLSVLDLARSMKNICSVVHVSTAYSNCDQFDIQEVVYPTNIKPRDVIHSFKWMDDELVESIAPKLIGGKPNTYTYTKALAEQLAHEALATGLPVCIVRPSIVVATYKEPIEGWVQNLNGPSGIFVACGKGVLRSILCDDSYRMDVIPLDYVVNLTIAAAWFTGNQALIKLNNMDMDICTGQRDMEVFHCCSGSDNPFYLKKVVPWAMDQFWKMPFKEVLWYPSPYLTTSPLLHAINDVLIHYIPAQLLDLLAKLKGEKPMMMFVYRKIKSGVLALRFFCTNEWNFSTHNKTELYNMLNKRDKELFHFNVKDVDWKTYTENYVTGIRKYLIKEDDKAIVAARKNLRKMYILHRGTQAFFCLILSVALGLLLVFATNHF